MHPPEPAPVDAAPPQPDAQIVEDGPLLRSHLAAHEKRLASLRSGLKKLQRAIEAGLTALQNTAAAQAAVDEALEDISAASLTSQSDVLGGLYHRELRQTREETRGRAARELERGREICERIKGAVERIKGVEDRRKGFDAESKKYYDELAKYLGRSDSDTAKTASLDSKQADRAASFRQQRIDYFSFLEGLVETEERAVAAWLRSWAGVGDEAEEEQREQARTATLTALEGMPLQREAGKGRGSAGSSKDGWIHVGGAAPPDAQHEAASLEGTSVEDASLPSGPSTPASDDKARRRRRSSIPHFHLPGVGGEHREPRDREFSGGTRERLKGFLKNAQNSIQSALPASVSSPNLALDALGRRPSPPPPLPSPTLLQPSQPFPHPAQTLSPPPQASLPRSAAASQTLSPPPPSASLPRSPSSALGTQMRRKEGFLFATETGQKHTSAGDGGARWHRFWVVLSEGQLVEYDKWQDAMSVHGTPINLRYASVRMSKNAERRFAFEVLTPEMRRVYQASGDKECQEWVSAISKSVESLLNGTSSVRHFDASRLTGNSTPYSLNEFGSTTSLARATPSPSSPEPPTSPKSRLPDFLSRRSSLGHGRKISTSKKDKRRSVQTHAVPSLTIGEEDVNPNDGTPVDRAFYDASTRRGLHAFSEGAESADGSYSVKRPTLNGLGIPFPSYPGGSSGASKSSPDLLSPATHGAQRSTSSPFPSSEHSSDDAPSEQDDSASVLSAQDRAITEAVRGWASTDEAGGVDGGASTAPPRRSSATAEETKYRNAVRIAQVAERAGPEWQNTTCADCRADEPRWASWNIGITLCIRCSGVHRSLGTHVSKVRSIELDDWSDEQLTLMEEVGNARSNAYYEARLPEGTIDALDDSTIAAFIREKYVDKRFAAEAPSSGPSALVA
ncbi:hypothetical protein JCM10207_007665 [Rhodosporidiobolus poonsookiae]